MALFHLVFDLSYFKGYPFDVSSGFWFYFARLVASSFLFLAGVSLYLSDSKLKPEQRFTHHLRRGLTVFGFGMLITLVTGFLFPQNMIWFGVLHAIGASIVFFWPLARIQNTGLVTAIFILFLFPWVSSQTVSTPFLLWLGFAPPSFQSFDYVPLIPWAAPFLLGMWTGKQLVLRLEAFGTKTENVFIGFLGWLGRHSLACYLLHQPVLVALVLLFG